MASVKTFIALFAFVQILFMLADGFDLWQSHRSRRKNLRDAGPVVLLVLSAGVVYFAVQLVLAFVIPGISPLLRWSGLLAGAASNPGAAGILTTVFVCVVAYFVISFFDYLVHRFLLHGLLWRLHENHHLPTAVSNLMPGIAARPFVAIPNLIINFCSGLFLLWLFRLFGNPALVSALLSAVPILLFWFAFIACASHSSFLRRFDWVQHCFRVLLLITPREHQLHHAAELKGNYGNFTAVWDRVFGTYLAPKRYVSPVMGLNYDQDFLGALTAGRVKLPPRLREQWQVAKVCRIDS